MLRSEARKGGCKAGSTQLARINPAVVHAAERREEHQQNETWRYVCGRLTALEIALGNAATHAFHASCCHILGLLGFSFSCCFHRDIVQLRGEGLVKNVSQVPRNNFAIAHGAVAIQFLPIWLADDPYE